MLHPFFASPRPLVFAHRGGSALAPENTIEAFDTGLALGGCVRGKRVRRVREPAFGSRGDPAHVSYRLIGCVQQTTSSFTAGLAIVGAVLGEWDRDAIVRGFLDCPGFE